MTTDLQTMTDEMLEKLHQILDELEATRREFTESNEKYMKSKALKKSTSLLTSDYS